MSFIKCPMLSSRPISVYTCCKFFKSNLDELFTNWDFKVFTRINKSHINFKILLGNSTTGLPFFNAFDLQDFCYPVSIKFSQFYCFLVRRLSEYHLLCRYGIGMIYYKQEKFNLAEIHFRKALSINPSSSVLYCHVGVVS